MDAAAAAMSLLHSTAVLHPLSPWQLIEAVIIEMGGLPVAPILGLPNSLSVACSGMSFVAPRRLALWMIYCQNN